MKFQPAPRKPHLPSSDGFWILSSGYRDAGDAVLRMLGKKTYTGFAVLACVFAYFRSIELALKAVLVHEGLSEKKIKESGGHCISTLLRNTEKSCSLSGLGIQAKDRQLLDHFSDDYSNKWFEYGDDLWRQSPQLDQLRDLAHRVCEAVRIHTMSA